MTFHTISYIGFETVLLELAKTVFHCRIFQNIIQIFCTELPQIEKMDYDDNCK